MKKDLQLVGVEATNFKKIEAMKVQFKKGHTRIIALNGHGKSTLKDVMQACCGGVSQTNRGASLIDEKFRVIGRHGKSSDLKTVFEDVKGGFTVTVTNHITKSSNDIKITASDGRTLTREWLIGFFNAAFMSASSFLSHTPKEQALLLGINTSEFDKAITELKADYTTINRSLKMFGDMPVMEKVEPVDVDALYKEKERINKHNKEQVDRQEDIDTQHKHITECKSKVAALAEQLIEAQKTLKGNEEFLKGMPVPQGHLVITHITEQIDTASATNAQATAYERNEEKRIAKEEKVADLKLAADKRDKEIQKKTDYIKTFKLPLKGLTVGEDGGLLLDERYIASYSTAEREIIVANLRASQNPNFKTVWIDDFQNLDKTNQDKIVKGLIDKDFNVITAEVGAEKDEDDGSILLRDCAVVGEEKVEDTRESAL